jgi:peptide/nickel transport system permease protein
MVKVALRRVAEVVITALGVVTVVFFLVRLAGDPVAAMLPIGASQAEIESLRHSLGYDQPLINQYFSFLGDLFTGHGQESTVYGISAFSIVFERFKLTVTLALSAILWSTIVGVIVGLLAAVRRGGWLDTTLMVGTSVGQAMPSFWVGILLILGFAVRLGWFPASGAGSIRALVLPTVTLTIFTAASIARVFRSALLDAMHQGYVNTARSKGLSELSVWVRHIVPNAMLPLITVIGLQVGSLLGGAVVTEVVFSWPGLGQLLVTSIERRDFPVVQAGVLVIGLVFVLVNLLTDLLYSVVDPRIRRKAA